MQCLVNFKGWRHGSRKEKKQHIYLSTLVIVCIVRKQQIIVVKAKLWHLSLIVTDGTHSPGFGNKDAVLKGKKKEESNVTGNKVKSQGDANATPTP